MTVQVSRLVSSSLEDFGRFIDSTGSPEVVFSRNMTREGAIIASGTLLPAALFSSRP
jgi:hypothetical protein